MSYNWCSKKVVITMKARVIAYYLPQFHPIKENDEFWGKGFTEWTNVAKAKPLFKGHYQPQVPADLGFYDLRLPEVREAQATMAKECGVEGFMYWNYWFGRGKKVLEMPIEEIMRTGKPNFPFCIGWANHDWSNKTWKTIGNFKMEKTFLTQEYLGKKDYTDYFNYCLPMFKDKRYITVDDKPLFYIFAPDAIPDIEDFIKLWNKLAIKNGLKGIHFVARVDAIGKTHVVNDKSYLNDHKQRYDNYIKKGFDAVCSEGCRRAEILSSGFSKKYFRTILKKMRLSSMNSHDYMKIINNYYTDSDSLDYVYPQIIPRMDRTPRQGKNAIIYKDNSPEKFRKCIQLAFEKVQDKNYEHRILFLSSWNEWGEGSYMEPDIIFGHEYLDVLKDEIYDE